MRGSGHANEDGGRRRDVGGPTFRPLPVDRTVTRRYSVYVPPALYDVPYVPTDDAIARKMLAFAGVTADDVVYDLGCGDGRIVVAAARDFGASGVGVDVDPKRVAEAIANAQRAGVSHRTRFVNQSFFDADFADATVVALYLLPEINARLRPRLLSDLRPGTRIVANHFGISDWQPDDTLALGYRNVYRWTVPARVTGRWRCVIATPRGGRRHLTLDLERRYQIVLGTATFDRQPVAVASGRLTGTRLAIRLADGRTIDAEVDGNRLRGHVSRTDGAAPAPLGGMRA
jgi:SAM-dependent methyltransferase